MGLAKCLAWPAAAGGTEIDQRPPARQAVFYTGAPVLVRLNAGNYRGGRLFDLRIPVDLGHRFATVAPPGDGVPVNEPAGIEGR